MADFHNTEEAFNLLTRRIGLLVKEVTKRKVVLDDDETIPKVEGEFILVSQTSADQLDWSDNEDEDMNGNALITHNYEITYTLTAYRGNAFTSLTKVLQGLNLPYLYEKYFPSPCPFAYQSASTVSRLRVPLNMQKFENRAVVLVTFNVSFLAKDTTAFEDIERINMEVVYSFNDPTQP